MEHNIQRFRESASGFKKRPDSVLEICHKWWRMQSYEERGEDW